MTRICFVCLGNICRSPTAEGVMRHLLREAGLDGVVEVDSAGTAGYHTGEPPDRRARAAGARVGIEVSGHARKVVRADFERFDYLLAMDGSNLEDLVAIAPPNAHAQLRLLRSFDPASAPDAAVPDPYHGDDAGFDEVLRICLAACRGLLLELKPSARA